jgi:integrase
VAINPTLAAYLSKLKEPRGEFVFPSLAQRNISPLSKHFRKLLKRTGIEQRVLRERSESGSGRTVNALSFHSFRHTFNSILANAGIPEETRMALTGHTTRAMNQVYTHRQLSSYRDAVAVVPAIELT